jgi:antirestriction protein ArdC
MNKTEELKAEMAAQVRNIIDAADDTRRSAAFQTWLKCAARFHRYSAGNVFLIVLQRPDASRVAGYKKWQQLGRQVRRGEKGIGILAPVLTYAHLVDDNGEETGKVQTAVHFTAATVFDISQTDGEPLPPDPDWRGDGRHAQIESLMVQYAHTLGIKTTEQHYTAGPVGWTTPGAITYSDAGNVPRTIAHELAHRLSTQQRADLGKDTDEPLTDLAAAIVCEHFGIEVTASTAAYIATWTADPKALLSLADRAQQTARQIIEALEALAAQPEAPAQGKE